MGNTNPEAIKAKLEKLFKKAESAKEIGSLEEAEIFMAKAQEILTKYNIEMAELNLGDDEVNPCGYEKVNMEIHGWTKVQGKWMVHLYNHVAKTNFCKIVLQRFRGGPPMQVITLIGEEHNMDTVRFMCGNIIPKLIAFEKKRWGEYRGPEKRGAFRRAYLDGAVAGIATKLKEQRNQDKEKYSGLPGIIVLKDKLVDEKTAEIFGKLKQARSRRLSANQAGAQGFSDGKNMKIDPGVGGKSKGSKTKYLN